ncbi:MAG: DUF4157 domain-containing protein [Proteobacteria bacterium]|nr:DUF4157 domain-containing protein [Pseudomonadota bacterium]
MIEDWTDVALRPGLYQSPLLRASYDEIGTSAPPYYGPIQAKRKTVEPAERPDSPASTGGTGSKLPADVQAKMEAAFAADFSAVRVHQGPHAPAIGAQAYTQGADVHFAPGQYQPHSPAGQELLGHELAHVVQQSQGRVAVTTQVDGVAVNDDASLEREADQMGARAAQGKGAGAQSAAGAPTSGLQSGGSATQKKAVIQRFESNEHKKMGDAGSGNAKIELSPGFEVSFGDITATAGDYFKSVAQIEELAGKPGDGKNCPGTRDEILYVLRVEVQGHEDEEESFGADLRRTVKKRYYEMASFNPTHFTNSERGDDALTHEQRANKRDKAGEPVNNAGSYRKNHIDAIKAAAEAGKSGDRRDRALLHEAFASHFLTDAYSGGHVRTERVSIEHWWNERVPMFWTNLHWWMAERIARYIDENNWRGDLVTVNYMWREGRTTIAKTLQDKGIPNLTFGNVISGAVHDMDNQTGVDVQVGDQIVKLFGDGEVLDKNDAPKTRGIETGKLAAAAVKVSLKDIHDAHAMGKAGQDPDAVVAALNLSDGLFRAEQLWPKALPDSAPGQAETPKWQRETVDELLRDGTMREALRVFANNKADELGKEIQMDEEYKDEALKKGVLALLKGDQSKVITTFEAVINYVPDTREPVHAGNQDPDAEPQRAENINADDNAMEYYRKARAEGALATLTTEQRHKAIQFLVSGSCADDEERAIIEMLDTATVPNMVTIVKQLGNGDVAKGIDYLDSGIDGAEWNTLCSKVLSKSPETSAHMDDNGVRAAVALSEHIDLNSEQKQAWITTLMAGSCGDDDEAAIIRIIQSSLPGDVKTIVDGIGYDKFWSKIDGAESAQMTGVLKDKGYFRSMSLETKIDWVQRMSSARTNTNAQELIMAILESSSPAEAKAIVDKVGSTSLDWDLTGSHQERFDAVRMDDDGVRAAVDAERHLTADLATKTEWITTLMDGSCGNDDEAAIIRIVESSADGDVKSIVDNIGYGQFWSKIDGAESAQMTGVLKDKGYFRVMSQSTKIHWVERMASGRTGDNAQELIVSILESADKSEVKAIIKKVGNLDWDLDGLHQDRYDALKKIHGL